MAALDDAEICSKRRETLQAVPRSWDDVRQTGLTRRSHMTNVIARSLPPGFEALPSGLVRLSLPEMRRSFV